MFKKGFLSLTFLLLVSVSFSQSKDWKTLKVTNYSIQYPDSFELNTSGLMGTSFLLFSNQSPASDLFRENINLFLQDLNGNAISLDQFVQVSENQLSTVITKHAIIESKRIKENNKEYHVLMYTGEQGQLKLKWMQYYYIVKGKAYALTYTAEQDQFDKYLDVAKKIMATFTVL